MARVSAQQQLLELVMIRERLDELARRRYESGLRSCERDEYERLADREQAILARLHAMD